MKTNIYVFRHGETDYNVQGRMQGYLDIPLNTNGLAQARVLADTLSNAHLDIIYSSPLSRAMKTAEIVADKNHVKIVTENGLSEWNLGVLCGHIINTIDAPKNTPVNLNSDTVNVSRELLHDDDFVPQNGESYNMLKKRVYETMINIVKNTDAKNIGIATHGGIIRLLIREFTNYNIRPGLMPNGGYFKMCWDGNTFSVPEKPYWLIEKETKNICY